MKQIHLALATAGIVCLIVCSFLIRGGRYSDGFVATAGVVLLDGKPLSDADIFMVPVDEKSGTHSYHGTTNAEGVYEVTGGMPPGEYRVVIRQEVMQKSRPDQHEIDQGQVQAMMASKALQNPQRSATTKNAGRQNAQLAGLPDIYRSAERTTLRICVEEDGSSDMHLLLTSDATAHIAKTDGAERTTQ